jgi:hypothetical protein
VQGPGHDTDTTSFFPTSMPAHRSITASIILFSSADEQPTKRKTKLFHGR